MPAPMPERAVLLFRPSAHRLTGLYAHAADGARWAVRPELGRWLVEREHELLGSEGSLLAALRLAQVYAHAGAGGRPPKALG